MPSRIVRAVGKLASCVFGGHIILEYFGRIVMSSGPSMEPKISDGDIFIVKCSTGARNDIKKGDIVLSKNPLNPRTKILKRVVALDGDPTPGPTKSIFHPHKFVPQGHVWLEGDNKENSEDSRVYGPVPYGLVYGRIVYKIWPSTGFTTSSTERKTVPKNILVAEDKDS